MKKLSVFILVVFASISALIIGCAKNPDNKDDTPDYPTPDHGNPVIEEIRGEVVDGGTLTLASGDSATFYGNAGPTVLQQIDLSARDIIPNEFVYCCESKNSRDSIRISGPIPSGVNPDSLYVLRVTYFEGSGSRVQSLYADGWYLVHGALDIPEEPTQYSFMVPVESPLSRRRAYLALAAAPSAVPSPLNSRLVNTTLGDPMTLNM